MVQSPRCGWSAFQASEQVFPRTHGCDPKSARTGPSDTPEVPFFFHLHAGRAPSLLTLQVSSELSTFPITGSSCPTEPLACLQLHAFLALFLLMKYLKEAGDEITWFLYLRGTRGTSAVKPGAREEVKLGDRWQGTLSLRGVGPGGSLEGAYIAPLLCAIG